MKKVKVSLRHKGLGKVGSLMNAVNTQIHQQIHHKHLSFDEQPFQKAADILHDRLDLLISALKEDIAHENAPP